MIKSWGNSVTRRLAEAGKATRFRGLDVEKAQNRLATLDAAGSLAELNPLRSAGLHKLTGDRAGQWAMTINGPWRLCFRFADGDAYDVEITDYHKG
jgi:toxin HigB-1